LETIIKTKKIAVQNETTSILNEILELSEKAKLGRDFVLTQIWLSKVRANDIQKFAELAKEYGRSLGENLTDEQKATAIVLRFLSHCIG